MRQNEYWRVVRRRLAPPTLPGIIGPWPAHRAEHVAAQDPCSNILKSTQGKFVIDARRPAALPGDLLEDFGVEEPVVNFGPPNSQGILQILMWPSSESIDRH